VRVFLQRTTLISEFLELRCLEVVDELERTCAIHARIAGHKQKLMYRIVAVCSLNGTVVHEESLLKIIEVAPNPRVTIGNYSIDR